MKPSTVTGCTYTLSTHLSVNTNHVHLNMELKAGSHDVQGGCIGYTYTYISSEIITSFKVRAPMDVNLEH